MDFTKEQVQKMLPQKEPFVFVDTAKNVDPGNYAVGLKLLNSDERIFKSHFPENPVFPASLQLEMMAQTAIVVILSKHHPREYRLISTLLLSIKDARFYKEIKPGSLLEIEVKRLKTINLVHCFSGKILVNGEICSSAKFMAVQNNDLLK